MKKTAIAVAFTMLSFIGCATQAPDPGHEIVLVEKPMFFGHGGIDSTPVTSGRSIVAMTTDGIDVNMQPEMFDLVMDDTMTSDGVPISFHAMLVLQVTDSVRMVSKFGPKWYTNNVLGPYTNLVRNAVRKHGMNETALSSTALTVIDTEIKTGLEAFIVAQQLPLKLVSFSVGKANPPDSVKHQRIETATQEQRIQTEQQKKLAEDQRKASEEARAKADNAYREAMQLSPQQFIQLETINMQKEVCHTATCTFIQNGVSQVATVNK